MSETMTPWLTEPARPGPVLLCPDTVSPCHGADVVPLTRWRLEDDDVREIETRPRVCRECGREV